MRQARLKDIPAGTFFTLRKPAGEDDVNITSVWVRDGYDRSSRTYDCYKYWDTNHWAEMKPDRKVWVDFVF